MDALGLLAAFPELAEAAADEDLPRLFPEGPFAELARALAARHCDVVELLLGLGQLDQALLVQVV